MSRVRRLVVTAQQQSWQMSVLFIKALNPLSHEQATRKVIKCAWVTKALPTSNCRSCSACPSAHGLAEHVVDSLTGETPQDKEQSVVRLYPLGGGASFDSLQPTSTFRVRARTSMHMLTAPWTRARHGSCCKCGVMKRVCMHSSIVGWLLCCWRRQVYIDSAAAACKAASDECSARGRCSDLRLEDLCCGECRGTTT